MRFVRRLTLLAALVSLLNPVVTQAACRWTWDCSGGYPCRQVQICDNTIDLPALRPPEISPIPAPSIRPIPSPTLPPLGTTECRPAYLCNAFGRCAWQTVCR